MGRKFELIVFIDTIMKIIFHNVSIEVDILNQICWSNMQNILTQSTVAGQMLGHNISDLVDHSILCSTGNEGYSVWPNI